MKVPSKIFSLQKTPRVNPELNTLWLSCVAVYGQKVAVERGNLTINLAAPYPSGFELLL